MTLDIPGLEAQARLEHRRAACQRMNGRPINVAPVLQIHYSTGPCMPPLSSNSERGSTVHLAGWITQLPVPHTGAMWDASFLSRHLQSQDYMPSRTSSAWCHAAGWKHSVRCSSSPQSPGNTPFRHLSQMWTCADIKASQDCLVHLFHACSAVSLLQWSFPCIHRKVVQLAMADQSWLTSLHWSVAG